MPYTIQHRLAPTRPGQSYHSRLEAVYALICARCELPQGQDPYDLRIYDHTGKPVDTKGLSLRQWARATPKESPNG